MNNREQYCTRSASVLMKQFAIMTNKSTIICENINKLQLRNHIVWCEKSRPTSESLKVLVRKPAENSTVIHIFLSLNKRTVDARRSAILLIYETIFRAATKKNSPSYGGYYTRSSSHKLPPVPRETQAFPLSSLGYKALRHFSAQLLASKAKLHSTNSSCVWLDSCQAIAEASLFMRRPLCCH